MAEGLGRSRRVTADRITAACAAVDRADFLPAPERGHADFNGPLPIGFGQTNSQPSTVRAMLHLLGVRPGDRVLDVGSGSGWTTALLAHLAGPRGSVVGVELVPGLVEIGSANLAHYGFEHATIRAALPGVLGLPREAPFDRILVSAMAETFPFELVEQLTEDGVMVVPVNGQMLRVTREGATSHGRYRFVPLR